MSRRKNKQRKQPLVDTATQQAYKQLVAVLDRSPVTPYGATDLTEAGRILNANPALVKMLQAIQDREYARQDALQRLDLKSNPTGAHPQSGMSGWTGTKNYPIGVANARLLRDWADTNEWVRAAINARRQQIERADIAVLPLDETRPYNKQVQKSIQQLLDQPNELRDSFRSLLGPVVEDVLVLDRGVISKNMTASRKPVALYYEDGSTIKIYPEWSGDPKEPRYLYEEPGSGKKTPLLNDECIVIMANGASYRYGLSPVQVLRQTIVADLEAMRSGADLVSMKPPPIALQMTGASDTQIRGFINAYDNEIAGRKQLFAFGGPQAAQMFKLTYSAKDNQWMEWQEYLMRKICAIFQISPQQLGFTMDINKANGATQQQIYEDTGLIPLLLLIEEYLNRELLSDFAPKMAGDRFNLDALNLRIMFPEVTEASRQIHIERVLQMAEVGLAGLPSQTLNMILQAQGQKTVKGGNTFYLNTATGPIPWLSYDGEYGDFITMPQGAQDPAGGLSTTDPDPDDAGISGDDSTATGDSNTAGNGAPTGGNGTQGNAGSGDASAAGGDAPTASAEKHYVVKKDDGEEHTGVMIAFFLDAKSAKKLAIPDGEPAEDMHITLAYLGKKDAIKLDVPAMKKLLSGYASEAMPLQGKTSGVGRFAASDSSDGMTPIYASVNVPGIQAWRAALVKQVEKAGYKVASDFEYTPHCTLIYIDEDEPMPIKEIPEVELSFDTLWLAVGDKRYPFPIGDGQYPKEKSVNGKQAPMVIRQSDMRQPGKRWSPSMLTLAKTPPVQHWQDGDVLVQDALAKMRKAGVISQTWNAGPNACDDCLANHMQTVPLMGRFNSGALTTPNHGNCECNCTQNKGKQ